MDPNTESDADGWLALIESARDAANELASALAGTILPQDALPGYRIVREIHRGGQGVVYRAVRLATGREVAVKVLRDGRFGGPRDIARFEREVRVLAQLSHPNIVGIHDRGSAGGFHFFVMDYIAGQALDAYIDERRPSLSERLELFMKIGRAVNAAHLRGVIHRDLKPSNVRIDDGGEPHVLDFGLAKIAIEETEQAAPGRRMTLTGQFVGTLPWASPEQADGPAEHVDLRTDVYSLGVILYYLLTGAFPYPVSGNMREVLEHILESKPIRPRAIRHEIDEDLETIVLKCLAKEPERRYQGVAALIEDIERYRKREPILARSPSTAYQLKKLIVRHKAPAALFMVLGLTIVGFAAAMSILYGRAAAARDQARKAETHAVQEADTANAIKKFLVQDLLSSAKPEYAAGRKVTVEEVLADASERIKTAFQQRPEIEASIRSTLGQVYMSLGLYPQAKGQLGKAVSLLSDVLGPTHLETLEARNEWIRAGLAGGFGWNADEASAAYLDDCRRTLGDDHLLTLTAGVRRSEVLFLLGNQAEGLRVLDETLERSRRVLGDDHPLTIAAYNDWAQRKLRYTAHRAELESLLGDALDRARKTLGDDHPETFRAMVNLGGILMEERRFADAEPLLRDGYEGLRRILGDAHPTVIVAMRDMVLFLQEKNRVGEAIAMSRRAVAMGRSILGDEHPATLEAVYYLGTDLLRRGCYSEAEELFRGLWETDRRLQGDDALSTNQSSEAHSFALLRLGRYAEAESGLRQAYGMRGRASGDQGVGDAWCLRQLIGSLAAQGRSQEARPFSEKMLALRREPASMPDTDAYALNCYAYDLLTVEPTELRDPSEALRIALLASERSGDEYHYNRFTLALAFEANGRLDEAVEAARLALAHAPLEHSIERAQYETTLARCLERNGDLEGAEQVFRDTLSARRTDASASDHDIAVSLFDLGSILLRHGKYAEGEIVLRESLEKRRNLFADPTNDGCPLTLECEISRTLSSLGRTLLAVRNYADAESYLLDANDRLSRSTACHVDYLPENAELLIDLYRNSGSPDRAIPYTTVLSQNARNPHP